MGLKRQIQLQELIKNDKNNAETTRASLPFTHKLLMWSLQYLNLDRSIVENRSFSQNWKSRMTNSVDPDGTARNEPSHLDLHCLHRHLCRSAGVKGFTVFPSTMSLECPPPASILYRFIAGRYRPVSYPDGPITARYRFKKNAYWACSLSHLSTLTWLSHAVYQVFHNPP